MLCQFCNQETWIPSGISKKSGKSYDAFCSNPDCVSRNMKPEVGFKKVAVQSVSKPQKQDEYVEGKKENTRLISRNSLMCEVFKGFIQLGSINEQEVIKVFSILWAEVEK
jgi:hypothetical protein